MGRGYHEYHINGPFVDYALNINVSFKVDIVKQSSALHDCTSYIEI